MALLSDKLWLIANNPKSFANGSKSIIRNKLGLCLPYLELSKTVMDLMVWKYRFAKDMWHILIFGSNGKICGVPSLSGKSSCLKRIRDYSTGNDRGGSRHSFAKQW